ncbi:MAG: aminoglycoside phosphotransferase family protein [Actinobacteria bacterium]|nr:aminoglycoside phosphotransferase family protein [Actinomycetota bacterium]
MGNDELLLADAGYPGARLLAAGMEGRVYRLGPDTVGKVPNPGLAPRPGITALDAGLARERLQFELPRPLGSVHLADGRVVRIERYLPGRPLDEFYDPDGGSVAGEVVDALGDVLEGLQGLWFDLPAMRILDGEQYVPSRTRWADALVDLGCRRFTRYGGQLQARDPGVTRTASDLLTFLAARNEVAPRVQHGDLCGANVLVDDSCRVTAVVDWGFLSVPAEPAFDAAIAAAVLDMYGPHATEVERVLTQALVDRFGFEPDVLLAYKGLYALVTSNVYSADGTDGHFAWCAAMVSRAEVRAAAASLAARCIDRVDLA